MFYQSQIFVVTFKSAMMITGVIETSEICRWYRFHRPWFSLQGFLVLLLSCTKPSNQSYMWITHEVSSGLLVATTCIARFRTQLLASHPLMWKKRIVFGRKYPKIKGNFNLLSLIFG